MAYTQVSHWTATPARHTMFMAPITAAVDWSVNPIMLYKGAPALIAIDAIAMMSTVALTDGTDAITFTMELHTQNNISPVTTDTKLLNNIMPNVITAGAANAYIALDWGVHAFMPIRALAPKAASSPSVEADSYLGEEKYDIVLRPSAKIVQTSGVLYIRLLHYNYIEGDFEFGTTGSCCTVGFTPATN